VGKKKRERKEKGAWLSRKFASRHLVVRKRKKGTQQKGGGNNEREAQKVSAVWWTTKSHGLVFWFFFLLLWKEKEAQVLECTKKNETYPKTSFSVSQYTISLLVFFCFRPSGARVCLHLTSVFFSNSRSIKKG
jgi:hypothetical protein